VSHPITAGPPRVQIQTQAGCNGRCVFCPNEAVLNSDLPHGKMSVDLFHKIIDELAEIPPRRIALYMMNEPLADKRVPEFVEYVSRKVPTAKSQIITNGTYLNKELGEKLVDAGLKQLKCSLQSLDDDVNTAVMGYPAAKVIDNCIAFQQTLNEKRATKSTDFRVSMVVTAQNVDEIPETRRFWKRHGVRLVTSALENRGGNIAEAENLNPTHDMRSMGDCIRPSRDLMILYNGQVPLCCVDWHRTTILGDVSKQSIRDVWHGQTVQHIRDGLAGKNGAPSLPGICVNCTESACPNHHRRGLKGLMSRLAAAL